MKTLEITNLSYTYPKSDKPVLQNVSFSASAGEITALIGANGAGKTTLLRNLTGSGSLSGQITMDGVPLSSLHTTQRGARISYLTQENPQLSSLTVFEVVLLGRMKFLGLKLQKTELERVWDTLDVLHLRALADRPFYALSGGQRKIVSIAQAIVKEPELLILDEPTANLDMQNELEVMDLIAAYTKAKNTATLVTLHDLNLASQFSNQLVLLKNGRVYAQGTPTAVITEEAIREAYGVETSVTMSKSGVPHLHMLRSVRAANYHFGERKQ